GSAGVDVETTVDTTITDHGVHLIDTNVQGPLGHGLSALLIGRSSTSIQGIFVIPGLIDADYEGIIKIMVHILVPPVSIPAGAKIAQLVPLHACVPKAQNKTRGDQGFGSTGQPDVLLAFEIGQKKPEEKVIIRDNQGRCITIKMLVDTGADVTII
ncbi:hypothetical protein N320_04010, partial [Buceros rhinoceros silvestris]